MTNQTIECACGCGQTLEKYDSRGRERKFVHNHHARLQPNKRKEVKCDNCGKGIVRAKWQRDRVKHQFCSKKCEGDWFTKTKRRRGKNNGHYNSIIVDCAGGCGHKVKKPKSLIERRNGRVYCPNCVYLVRSGRQGFYAGYPKAFSPKLRKMIRQRDNYTCQECGKKQKKIGYTLHVHHIDYNKQNNSPMNLISLCRTCHGITNFGTGEWQRKYEAIMISRYPDLLGGLPL